VGGEEESPEGYRVMEIVRGEGDDLGWARLLINGIEVRVRHDAKVVENLDKVRVAVKKSKVPTRPTKDWVRPPKHIEQMYHKMNPEQRARYTEWTKDYYKDMPEKRWAGDRFPVVEKAIRGVLEGSKSLPTPPR